MYYTTSTAVTIDTQKTIGWLSTARFNKNKFIGTATQFYDTWVDRLRQYNLTVPTAEALTDPIALQMLKMSFSEEESFFKIQTNENARVIQGGAKFTFQEYKTALKDQCGIFDKVNYKDKATLSTLGDNTATCKVNLHEMLEYIDEDIGDSFDQEGQDDYSLDHSIEYLVNAARRRRQFPSRSFQGPRLDNNTWRKLSPDGRKIWAQLTQEDKESIIKYCTTNISKDATSTSKDVPKEPARKVNMTDVSETEETVNSDVSDSVARLINLVHAESTGTSDRLVNMTRVDRVLEAHPGDIRHVLSVPKKDGTPRTMTDTNPSTETRNVKVHTITYNISQHLGKNTSGSLVDRGANGGFAGCDVRVISKTSHSVNITGIDNHQMSDIPIVTVGAVFKGKDGNFIGIMSEYAYVPTSKSIHSSGQLEWFGAMVDDRSIRVKGKQCITTKDDRVIPLDIINGLPYTPMRPFTDKEWDTLPHVQLTLDSEWDPRVLDHSISNNDEWYDAVSEFKEPLSTEEPFTKTGDLRPNIVYDADVPDDQYIPPPRKPRKKKIAPEPKKGTRFSTRLRGTQNVYAYKVHKASWELAQELIPDELASDDEEFTDSGLPPLLNPNEVSGSDDSDDPDMPDMRARSEFTDSEASDDETLKRRGNNSTKTSTVSHTPVATSTGPTTLHDDGEDVFYDALTSYEHYEVVQVTKNPSGDEKVITPVEVPFDVEPPASEERKAARQAILASGPVEMDKSDVKYTNYLPNFLFAPLPAIKRTFKATTQYYQ